MSSISAALSLRASSSQLVWYFIFNKQQHKFYAFEIVSGGSERQGECSSSECLWLGEHFRARYKNPRRKPSSELVGWWRRERENFMQTHTLTIKNKLCAIPSVCRAQIVCHVTFNAIYFPRSDSIVSRTARFECKSRGDAKAARPLEVAAPSSRFM
jgi:hypothetical protein